MYLDGASTATFSDATCEDNTATAGGGCAYVADSATLDFTDVRLPLEHVLYQSHQAGAFAAPCHPGRKRVGLFSHYEQKGQVDGVHTVEVLNGGSIPGEDDLSLKMAAKYKYKGFGGSDSHVVSRIGYCATDFPEQKIYNMDDLVNALEGGSFHAVSLRPTQSD